MCGIAGIIDISRSLNMDAVLSDMRDALNHRGPDDGGLQRWEEAVGLAHTRLSIIDLSALGRQPMCNEDGSVWITLNGEIYNHLELRAELVRLGHQFKSKTDTEVVLHAYEEWGAASVNRLRGMFAYGIYDRRGTPDGQLGMLSLFRDRIGIKPLFYYFDGKILAFASEMKAIFRVPGLDLKIDRTAIFDYLTYGYIPSPKSAYALIRKLEPGHFIKFGGQERMEIQQSRYWDISFPPPSFASESDTIADIRSCLYDAVQSHMLADVPIGVFLSGGMDSSSVVGIASKLVTHPIDSFSIGFDVPEHTETEFARIAAERFKTTHHELEVSRDSVPLYLDRVINLYDEPNADYSIIPTLVLSNLARSKVKVALSGDGGDELFAGYKWYLQWLDIRKSNWIPGPLRRAVSFASEKLIPTSKSIRLRMSAMGRPELEQYASLVEVFSPREKRQLIVQDWAKEFKDYDDYWYFRKYWRTDLSPLTRVQYLDFKTYLHDDILAKVDRASMAVSLEVRPPLLDHLLIEKVFSYTEELRLKDNNLKYLLKEAVRDILPTEILNRSKKGFSIPSAIWLNHNVDWVTKKMKESEDLGLIRYNESQHRKFFNRGMKTWSIIVVNHWLRSSIKPSLT